MPTDGRNANFTRQQILVYRRLVLLVLCRSAHGLQLYVFEERAKRVTRTLQPVQGAIHYIGGSPWIGNEIINDEGYASPGQNLLHHGVHLPTKRSGLPAYLPAPTYVPALSPA